jgi:hypothetical protein
VYLQSLLHIHLFINSSKNHPNICHCTYIAYSISYYIAELLWHFASNLLNLGKFRMQNLRFESQFQMWISNIIRSPFMLPLIKPQIREISRSEFVSNSGSHISSQCIFFCRVDTVAIKHSLNWIELFVGATSHTSQEPWPRNCESPKPSVWSRTLKCSVKP